MLTGGKKHVEFKKQKKTNKFKTLKNYVSRTRFECFMVPLYTKVARSCLI